MANWAWIVGINEYRNLQSLKYAVADAAAMRDYCREAGFDQVFYFADDSPGFTAADGSWQETQPTFGTLISFLEDFFAAQMLGDGDNFWFFFSGHGLRHEGHDYLLPSDSNPRNVQRTGIPVYELTERLRAVGADNVILLLDACRNVGVKSAVGIGEEIHQGVITLYSCAASGESYEIESLQHGAFTAAVLETLATPNCATVEKFCRRICYRVPELNRTHERPEQYPIAQVEPNTKNYWVLLPQLATDQDLSRMRECAFEAEADGDWLLAKQLWQRVLIIDSSDSKAWGRYEKVLLKRWKQEFFIQTPAQNFGDFIGIDLGKGITLELVKIPSGVFLMGAPENEPESQDYERPQHQVKIKSFYFGRYPVTQAQYQSVMKKNPSGDHLSQNRQHPVEKISWYDANIFCQKLSEQTNLKFRLPSEAEWEYACRAGTQTHFSFGEMITTDQVNYAGEGLIPNTPKGKYREKATKVGSFSPNDFGLYDMHGNVYEWCEDVWHDNYQDAPVDGRAWSEKNTNKNYPRVLRGGSWICASEFCRSAHREAATPDTIDICIGFRVCVA